VVQRMTRVSLDIPGIQVGNAHEEALKSGVTAVLFEEPAIASMAVHGGAPGTFDTTLLDPQFSVDKVDGVFLCGGSAFGLEAGSGIQAAMREQGRGFKVGSVNIPIVPGAILFDLLNGGKKDWHRFSPYRDLGYAAAKAAGESFAIGSQGAGYGALVAELRGGLGAASTTLKGGIKVSALMAVNALGSPLIGDGPHFQAALFEQDAEFGGLGLPAHEQESHNHLRIKLRRAVGTNTTIGMVITNAPLDKAGCKRLAVAAHDGIARAIWPAHTPMDGDLIFAVSTGTTGQFDELTLSAAATSVVARSIALGVYEASPNANGLVPAYRQKFSENP